MRWVVFEPAVLWWVVRRGYNDAVRQVFAAATVVGDDSVRNNGRRREAALRVHTDRDAIGCKNSECGFECRFTQTMRIDPEEQRAVDAVFAANVADCLSRGRDVRLVE